MAFIMSTIYMQFNNKVKDSSLPEFIPSVDFRIIYVPVHNGFICSPIIYVKYHMQGQGQVRSLDVLAHYCRPGQEGRTKGLAYRQTLVLHSS